MSDFRERRLTADSHKVFYVTDSGAFREEIVSLPWLRIEGIVSPESLRMKLLAHSPDLILMESKIRWADPVATIRLLAGSVDAPIVMVCEGTRESDAELIKRAYVAGVYDTLYAPLCPDDVMETLEVLLKYRKTISLNQ